MTHAQLDHLRAIIAFLDNLLEQAKKRTPGHWNTQTRSYQVQTNHGGVGMYVAEMMTMTSHERDCDAAFIASCAGNAEAGWIATRAAIAAIEYYSILDENLETMAETILAAFPLELIGS